MLLLAFMTGGLLLSREKQKEEPEEEVVVIPDNYENNIVNSCSLPTSILNVIIDYTNAYYKSLYTLEYVDTSDLFCYEMSAVLSEYATKLQIDSRKLYDYDFSMSDAHYDLKITDYYSSNGVYYVDVLQNDTFYFKYLNGIESNAYGIEITYAITLDGSDYKIKYIDKVQDYWVIFDDPISTDEIIDIYNTTLASISSSINAKQASYTPSSNWIHQYNREKAREYIDAYYHDRNDEYYDFTNIGGNCQNYASQAIYYAGIPMDLQDEVWKYFDSENDDSCDKTGRSSSWTGVVEFYNYCKDNEEGGIVADVNVPLQYGEVGDVIQVGFNNCFRHTTIISKVVDGHILVNSNSVDLHDYPVEAYVYPLVRLIKILGYN